MRLICVTLFVTLMLATTVLARSPILDKCGKLCVYSKEPGLCGVSVDGNKLCHRYFRNYCELRQHNCRHKKDRYQAEVDMDHCPGHDKPATT